MAMRFLLTSILLLWAGMTFAQSGVDATLSWAPPSTYTDNSPLDPATDLTEFRIYLNGALHQTSPNTATTAIVPNLPFGSNEFYVTAVATNGNESVMSNIAIRTVVDNRVPGPPTLIDVILAWIRHFFARFA